MTFYFQFTYNLVSQSLFSWTQHNTGIEICILRNIYVSRSGISVCVTVIIQGHPFFFRCVLLNCLSFLKKFQQYMIQVFFWTEEASGFFWRLKFNIFFSSKSKVRRSEVKHLQGTRGAQVPISKSRRGWQNCKYQCVYLCMHIAQGPTMHQGLLLPSSPHPAWPLVHHWWTWLQSSLTQMRGPVCEGRERRALVRESRQH